MQKVPGGQYQGSKCASGIGRHNRSHQPLPITIKEVRMRVLKALLLPLLLIITLIGVDKVHAALRVLVAP
ncbi:hypothetical protein GCM10017655_51800 [Pseudomonas turukhanskensis]|uniref:Uncharacterized protein n=1 Tax=Pseudomonas turukhanskensis TaxID=1806536 RepID=A0A9W6K9L3_9PSED|nr:hypothetical protein GCM10017655_51800 [Pseudomonas turukhanskensis]